MAEVDIAKPLWLDSPFLRSCRGLQTDYTPVWLMRQAGRFMPEFQRIRSRVGFLELCKDPELACEVTVMAVEMLSVDAAIIFADILLPVESFALGLEYVKGEGPVIHRPLRTTDDINALPSTSAQSLSYVFEAIKLTRRTLPAHIPLIGFAGAPFTLASYMIEGGGSRNFDKTKQFMYLHKQSWLKLLDLITEFTADYLNGQVQAGAQALQVFDSWVGCLSRSDYAEYVAPATTKLFQRINKDVPVIHFGTGTSSLLEEMSACGGDVIGVDWRIDLDQAWQRIGTKKAIQGNLDPCVLLSNKNEIARQAKRILSQANRPGHIFNLGHGVLPNTDADNVRYLVEFVHEESAR